MIERSYYKNSIGTFLNETTSSILGTLTCRHHFSLDALQKNSWVEQIEHLKQQLSESLNGQILIEYMIPRMGKRIDVVLFIKNIIFAIEYKIGAKYYDQDSIDQVVDYSLDLKNFHEGSHHRHIVPIVIATRALKVINLIDWFQDKVAKPLLCNGDDLNDLIIEVLTSINANNNAILDVSWSDSPYKPVPTIIEAAQAMYQGHNVIDIARSDSGGKNLSLTSTCIFDIIRYSKKYKRKSICFLTGVPGAGKTLAGLNVSTSPFDDLSKEQAVFLSGNGPLVCVLREALARDEVIRNKEKGKTVSKKEAMRKVSQFIQNIHHFRDHHLDPNVVPYEHVVIFDEAQRAWSQKQAEKFMIQKKGQKSFDMSEPEFLISIMDRRNDWATIVCLIGGGQEINTGEAGLVEWINALQKWFSHWDIYHSGQLFEKSYNWGQDLNKTLENLNVVEKKALHLSVSMRSFREEKWSAFVESIIDGDHCAAAKIKKKLNRYSVVITRDLNQARAWLRRQARGNERVGLLASSGGIRLKSDGIHVKSKINPPHWFLNKKDDTRSSYYLEDVATEFDIQGLELDWTGLCWDADLRIEDNQWAFYNFKGTKWQNVNNIDRRVYLANAYRVLLTRARQGMVIFIPQGDDRDHTRLKSFYDSTYRFLCLCEIEKL